MKNEIKIRKHHFDIIIDDKSKILILGSLPSLMSEKNNFYSQVISYIYCKCVNNVDNIGG